MHQKQIIVAGKKSQEANKALIMLHGRGGSAEDILSLAPHLNVKEYALLAPQATNNTWYPLSFIAPPEQNEPWLSYALNLLHEIVNDINAAGIDKTNIYFLGFSQGACLTLEFVTRNATRWGGVVGFTGGLIGDKLRYENYTGDFDKTPVLIATSDPDPHIPMARVNATTLIMQAMNATVTKKIYPDMGHTINQDEIDMANELVFRAVDMR